MPDDDRPSHLPAPAAGRAARGAGRAPAQDPDAGQPSPASRRPHPGFDHFARALGAADDLPIDPDLDPDDPRLPSPTHRAHALVLASRNIGALLCVFSGGFFGTLLRYLTETAWPAEPGRFPTATFLINTTGAFLLGLVLTLLLEHPRLRRAASLRRFLTTGLIGGWTTYSTLAVETVTLAKSGDIAVGAGYVAVTLVCGVSAAACGIALARSRSGQTQPETDPSDERHPDESLAGTRREHREPAR